MQLFYHSDLLIIFFVDHLRFRGPPKGSSRAFPSKRSNANSEKESSNKSQRRSSADVHSQTAVSLPPHLRAQSGGNHSEYTQSASHSPIEGTEARDNFPYGRQIQPQREYLNQDGASINLSHPNRFDPNQSQMDSLQYQPADMRPSFAPMHQHQAEGGLPPDSRFLLPSTSTLPLPVNHQNMDPSSSAYYSVGSGSRPIPSHQQLSSQPAYSSHPQHQITSQSQSQSNYPPLYSQPRPQADSFPSRLDLNTSPYRRQTSNFASSPPNPQTIERERLETSRAFGAGSTWQPPTRTMPGPLPVPTSAASSANSPSSGSQDSSTNRGPLYSHYRGGTSGLGFFDSTKKKRQLPPLDFEREFTPGGSLRSMPSLDPNRQLPPILGESNLLSDSRSSTLNSPSELWKPPGLSNMTGPSLPSPIGASSSSRFSPPASEARHANALESYDAPENITFANGSLHAIAQERRRESSKLMMGIKVKNFGGERTPNMSETSRDASRDSSSHQGFTPADQKDSPSSATQTAATSTKGKEKLVADSPRSVGAGVKSNARRRENSPDEEEAPLALLDMGGLLADEISPLIITASQPRVPSVVIDQ